MDQTGEILNMAAAVTLHYRQQRTACSPDTPAHLELLGAWGPTWQQASCSVLSLALDQGITYLVLQHIKDTASGNIKRDVLPALPMIWAEKKQKLHPGSSGGETRPSPHCLQPPSCAPWQHALTFPHTKLNTIIIRHTLMHTSMGKIYAEHCRAGMMSIFNTSTLSVKMSFLVLHDNIFFDLARFNSAPDTLETMLYISKKNTRNKYDSHLWLTEETSLKYNIRNHTIKHLLSSYFITTKVFNKMARSSMGSPRLQLQW